jgi:hypothetical protein
MVAVAGLHGCGRSALSPLQSSTIRHARRSHWPWKSHYLTRRSQDIFASFTFSLPVLIAPYQIGGDWRPFLFSVMRIFSARPNML